MERRQLQHFKVVVVGAGPAGVGTVCGLRQAGLNGNEILVVERAAHVGGIPFKYGDGDGQGGGRTFVEWTRGRVVTGGDYAARLQAELAATGAHVWTETHVKQLLLTSSSLGRDNRGSASAAAEAEAVGVSPKKGLVLISAQLHGEGYVTADAVVLACGARETGVTERGDIAGARTSRMCVEIDPIPLSV